MTQSPPILCITTLYSPKAPGKPYVGLFPTATNLLITAVEDGAEEVFPLCDVILIKLLFGTPTVPIDVVAAPKFWSKLKLLELFAKAPIWAVLDCIGLVKDGPDKRLLKDNTFPSISIAALHVGVPIGLYSIAQDTSQLL